MQSKTLASRPARPAPWRVLATVAARIRVAIRLRRIPAVDDLPPHIRQDIGLPPEVHRPKQAPPRVF